MNKKLLIPIGILVVIVIVALALMIGRPRGPERPITEEQPTEITEEQSLTNPYDSAKEISPIGESAKNMNNAIKPILVSVFGGAKLTFEFTEELASTIDYTVKRPVVQGDAQKLIEGLKSLMEDKGYKLASTVQMEEGGFMIRYEKEDGAEMGIVAGSSGNKQEVAISYH